MKLTCFLIFLSLGLVQAAGSYAQKTMLTLEMNNRTVEEVLQEIEKMSDFHFFYNTKQVDVNRTVSIKSSKRDVFFILNKLFEDTDVTYSVYDKSIILSAKKNQEEIVALQQQKMITVKGMVVDAKGEPIIGANVTWKTDKGKGVATDLDGKFSIEVPENMVLVVSFMGFTTREVTVTSTEELKIVLQEDVHALEEVVVTALGIKRSEKALGYAVQKMPGESLMTVKTVDVATGLTGKIAGLNVQNSTEFNEAPTLVLRGETPLLVIDGVPYGNISLRDIAPDDIESIDVLKGATASALYGARGGSGAIMVTTKRGKTEGLSIDINSSTMFQAGYLKLPKAQHSYSTGQGGKYDSKDFVWGDKMDIGRTAVQYDPETYEWREMPLVSKGKNNFKNFLELSFITNNNISLTMKGKMGSIRTSLTHVYNKGQYPNMKLNKFTYSVAGDIKYKNFSFEGGATYNKRFYPNNIGTGYGGSGFMYNLLVWTGADYDIRDYKNYWRKKDEEQNWMNEVWYDNPYFIAHEILRSSDYDVFNGYLSLNYEILPWLKAALRSGIDVYTEKKEWRNAISARGGWNKKGYYEMQRTGGYSINNDLMLTADYKVGDFGINGFVGGTIYYYSDDAISGKTQNGISIPGYYSLKASVDPAYVSSSLKKKQVNSIYGKLSLSWKSTVFVDVTGRNDWSSTLPEETRSYFYPSVAASVVLSEFIPMPDWFSFWKVRGSWTQTKNDLSVYETNNTYSVSANVWDGLNSASYPSTIRGATVKPSASRSWEIGSAFNLWTNRLQLDVAYYNKLKYNLTRSAGISDASGFSKTLINIEEEQIRKGVEITVSGNIIKTKDWNWHSSINWARDRFYYDKVDPKYSTQRPWVAAGKRWDWLGVYDWERDPEGNIIHRNGMPVQSDYESVVGYEYPDWIWGWTNTIRYKNLSLNFTLDGRVGGVCYSWTEQALWNTGAHRKSDNKWRYDEVVNGLKNYVGKGVEVVSGSVDYDSDGNIIRDDRVFAPNTRQVSYESYIREYHSNAYSGKSQNYLDQTFFKLRDLSLTYNLPASACARIGMKGASISFVGQNVFVWAKEFKYSDPDKASDNLNSPSVRYLGFNIKLNL